MRDEIRELLKWNKNLGRGHQPPLTSEQLALLALDLKSHCYHVYSRRFETDEWHFRAAFTGARAAATFCSYRKYYMDGKRFPHFEHVEVRHPLGVMDEFDIKEAAAGWRA